MAQGGSELVAWRRAMAHMRIAYTVSLVTHMSLLTDPELKLLTPPDTYRLRDINLYTVHPLLSRYELLGPRGSEALSSLPEVFFPSFRTLITCVQASFVAKVRLLRINQWHHGLRTRLWHTPPAAVKKPTEESTRERDLGVSVGRDSRYGSIYVCPPLPPGPRALVLPPSSSFPPLSPPDPTPSIRPTGRWRGTHGPLGASSAGLLLGRPARLCAGGGLVVGRRQPLG